MTPERRRRIYEFLTAPSADPNDPLDVWEDQQTPEEVALAAVAWEAEPVEPLAPDVVERLVEAARRAWHSGSP